MAFEIGMAYTYCYKVFLAISEEVLIHKRGNEWVTLKPYVPGNYKIRRNMPVDELAAIWETTSEDIDGMSAHYMHPLMTHRPSDADPSYRTAQRRQAERLKTFGLESESGRLHRLAAPRGSVRWE